MGNWEDYLEGNYDEKGNLIKKYKQRKDDEHQAKEIEEQIEKMYEYYKKREDIKEYLMDGADLQCNQATLEPFEMSDGTVIKLEFNEETEAGNEEKKITRIKRRQTELQVTSNTQTTDNGSLHATVFDCIQGENIHSFKCNCKLVDDREEEYRSIKNDPECTKKGVCQYLMKLNEQWENLPVNGRYETITVSDPEDETKEKIMECITMTSVLFCKHGGLITPVDSGQEEEEQRANFVGYLLYGAGGVTQNSEEGFFRLYDSPTLNSIGERYNTKELYEKYGVEPNGALQSFAGSGKPNKSGDIKYGEQQYDSEKGTLLYNGIERYGIALGPKLQNPNCNLEEIKPNDMAYGTCVDIEIELNGDIYYIPAIIVDVKAHSAPTGIFQTGIPFEKDQGEYDTGKTGPIVEWYVKQNSGERTDKTVGLKKFNTCTTIIIYRQEILY